MRRSFGRPGIRCRRLYVIGNGDEALLDGNSKGRGSCAERIVGRADAEADRARELAVEQRVLDDTLGGGAAVTLAVISKRYQAEDVRAIFNWWQDRMRKAVHDLPSEWAEAIFAPLTRIEIPL